MIFALCPGCGAKKRRPDVRCAGCGLDPAGSDEVLVRSVYLSVWRYEESQPRLAYAKVLASLGADLRAGRAVEFDAADLERIGAQLQAFRALPPSAIWVRRAKLALQAFTVVFALLLFFGLVHMVRVGR